MAASHVHRINLIAKTSHARTHAKALEHALTHNVFASTAMVVLLANSYAILPASHALELGKRLVLNVIVVPICRVAPDR